MNLLNSYLDYMDAFETFAMMICFFCIARAVKDRDDRESSKRMLIKGAISGAIFGIFYVINHYVL